MAAKKSSGVHLSWPKPIFQYTVKTHKQFKSYYQAALMYAHYELTANDLKKEVIKQLRSKDPKDPILERIKDIHENRFVTVGKYMYILNHGGDLPEDIAVKILPFLEKIINEEEAKIAQEKKELQFFESKASKNPDTSSAVKVVSTIQDRLREKAHEAAGEVEGWLDEFCADKKSAIKSTQDFTNLFRSYDLKAPHARLIHTFFQNRADEINVAVEGKDKFLLESYSNFTKPELKKLSAFYANLLSACTMMQEAAKVVRVPRKPKPISQEKIVAKVKFKKEDVTLGIVSLSPIQILGSKEVWLYNTKTRKLAQYKALDERGLLIKGSSLENYSADSVEKTLRKPPEQLAEFKKASKVKLRTFLKEIKAVDISCKGKITEYHVILRADK